MKVSLRGSMCALFSGVAALVLAGNTARADEFGSRYEQSAASPAIRQGEVFSVGRITR